MRVTLVTRVSPAGPPQGDVYRLKGLVEAVNRLADDLQWVDARRPPVGLPAHFWPPYFWHSRGRGSAPTGDIVIAFQLAAAPLALSLPAPRRVLDLTDSLDWYRRRLGFSRLTWAKHLTLAGIGRREVAYGRQFDQVWVSAEPDRQWLRKYGLETAVVPNGVNEKVWLDPADPKALVMVGNFRYLPNRLGVTWFLEHIWPSLASRGYRLTLVGRGSEAYRAPGVDGRGFVEDLLTVYRTHGVAISPVGTGSGAQNKILEAMGYGRPVICRASGAIGLSRSQREAVFVVGDTVGEWLAAFEQCADSEIYRRKAEAAFQSVQVWGDAAYHQLRGFLANV